jgi:hypothetical protein
MARTASSSGGDVHPGRHGPGEFERHEPGRDPPAGKGNPLNRLRHETSGLLPAAHGVDEGLDRPRGLDTGRFARPATLGEEDPVEMRFVPGVVPVGKPEPNDVVKGIVGDPTWASRASKRRAASR